MDGEERARVYTRREALELTVTGVAGAAVLSACNRRDLREFRVAKAFEWEPADVVRDVAFAFVSDRIVDYVDGLCNGCGAATRFFLFAFDVAATAATIPCPQCSIGTRITVALAKELVSEIALHGFGKALGILDGDFYRIMRVGPVRVGRREFSVSRSAVCYDIEDREPTKLFNREIAAFPERICYFTQVAGAPGLEIFHVWRCNGEVTDRIPLAAASSTWRTSSHKHNLARGAWIVTTELPSGAILDSREFHIR